jgi:hypothetical protein
MQLLEVGFVDEVTELPHKPTIKSVVIFVLRSVYHVKIAGEEPGSRTQRPEFLKLCDEGWFVCIAGWTIH